MCDVAKLRIRKRCKTPTEGLAVLVRKDGIDVPICNVCWKRIGDGDWEIGPDPKIENFKEWLERERGLEKGILTEYNPEKTGVGRYKTIQEEDKEITSEDELDEAEGKALMEEDEERESQEVSKS